MALRNGHVATMPAPAPLLGEVGQRSLVRSLGNNSGDTSATLADLLARAYLSLSGGDAAAAQQLLGEIVGPALQVERAFAVVPQAAQQVQVAQQQVAAATPLALDADLALDIPRLQAWQAALEQRVAADMELGERIAAVLAALGAA